jgi:signal recognition particle subunit SRP54
VREFIAKVKEKALGEEVISSLSPGQALVGVVQRELTAIIGGDYEGKAVELNLAVTPPAVILMAGLQGAGKTTTVGKLAKLLREKYKKKVLTVSCDVYRPAAIAQLKTVTEQVGADFFPSEPDQKPVDIARAAVDWAKRHYHDVLLVDTAGRLGIDEAMMQEIAALHRELKPAETLFVVDAMLGQDAVNTAKAFSDALPLTGVVLTKLDGDSRGGAALSVRHVTGKPIKFVGVAEKLDGLEVFYPDRMANRILGMGDILALVEEAQRGVDVQAAQKLADKVKKGGDFDLNDFRGCADGQAARAVPASRRRRRYEPGRKADAPHGRHHQFNDAAGARQARSDQGHPQAPHRRGRGRAGAGSQPHAEPVRPDAHDDEEAQGRQSAKDDARHEGHVARHALSLTITAAALVRRNCGTRG